MQFCAKIKSNNVWGTDMSDFIVLGLIPGTNIQIGLLGWTAVFVMFAASLYIIRRGRRAHTLRFLLIRASLTLALRRQAR